jgi:diaminopimelate decarboxylase
MKTPAYIFYENKFQEMVANVKHALGEKIPLCYSIKANPFLLNCLPEALSMIEVCSPGELSICEEMHIAPERIIYSGVMKETEDIERAVRLEVGIMTGESLLHVQLENEACLKYGVRKKVILRFSSGNQFGMSKEDICSVIANRFGYPGLEIVGLHYYSGTQKKLRSIEKDLQRLEGLLTTLRDDYGFEPELVEYGPGLPVEYFQPDMVEQDKATLTQAAEVICRFAEKYPLGIEMGRFLASSCGVFVTQVKDIKRINGENYVICDGGIHHLKYYGQTMAMKIPPVAQASSVEELLKKSATLYRPENMENTTEDREEYCLCGSLCTVADVLVRSIELSPLSIGDYLMFGKCGAYSVTEGASMFLSRDLPGIYLCKEDNSLQMLRSNNPTYVNNIADIEENSL